MLVFPTLMLEHEFIFCLGCAEGIHEPLPDIAHRQRRRMHQIIGIKTVVTEFIKHYFECFKIMQFTICPFTMYHLVYCLQ